MTLSPTLSLVGLSEAFADLLAAAGAGLVHIAAPGGASGFVWRPGLIVTAEEALPDQGEVAVRLPSGEEASATVAGRDVGTDVALLRVAAETGPGVAFRPDAPRVGSLVLAAARGGSGLRAAAGLLAESGPAWRSMRGGEISARVELDLRLAREAEGGLALDAEGRAFGMTVLGPARRALVIPAETLERAAEELARHGRIRRGWLGLSLAPVRVEGERGALVAAVAPGGPAAAAGLVPGDIVLTVDGEPVRRLGRILRGLGAERIGASARLLLLRAGARVEVEITVAERPDA